MKNALVVHFDINDHIPLGKIAKENQMRMQIQ